MHRLPFHEWQQRWPGILQRIRPFILETPVREVEGELRLKLENFQRTGSFKIRGASSFITRHWTSKVYSGVITASSGNHGTAVACIAKKMGIRAVIVVPEDVRSFKLHAIMKWGADIVKCGYTSDERISKAIELADKESLLYVPPYDHEDILLGHASIAYELLRLPEPPSRIFVPVGGGGLISGIAWYIKTFRRDIQIIGVEPESVRRYAYPDVSPEEWKPLDTIADGLRVVRPGRITGICIDHFVDDLIAVTNDDIRESLLYALSEGKIFLEPSGAASIAGALKSAHTPRDIAIVSGGNVDPETLCHILSQN